MLEQLRPAGAAAPQPQQQSDLSQIRSMYQMYRAAQNPAAMLQQMMMQNPMLGQLAQIQQSGGNLQNAFYSLCQRQGVNPQTILKQLTT